MSLASRTSDLANRIALEFKSIRTALTGKANASHTHVATTDLTATGTKNSTTYLRGDNTWAAPTAEAPSNMVTTDTQQTITGKKNFWDNPIFQDGWTTLGTNSYGELIPDSATSGSPSKPSPLLRFYTARWDGAASVYETLAVYAVRGSSTVGDYWLSSDKPIKAPALYDNGMRVAVAGPLGVTTTAPAANRFGKLVKWTVVGYTTFAVRLLVIAKGGDGQSASSGLGSAVISVRIVGLAAGFNPAIVTVKFESGDTMVASDFRYSIGAPSIEDVVLYVKSEVAGEQYEVFELARSTNGTVNTSWGTASDPWITFVPNDPPNSVTAFDATDLVPPMEQMVIQAKVATTANSSLNGLATVDGVTLVTGDTVLVKNQVSPAFNGVYVASPYAWTRHPAADSAADLAGLMVRVIGGSTQYGLWVCTFRASDTIGVTFQSWYLVTHAGAVASLPPSTVVRLTYTTIVPSRPTAIAGSPYVEWVGAVSPGASALAGDTWINTNP